MNHHISTPIRVFSSWSFIARDANIRQPWTSCSHLLTTPYTRLASLREGSISPWWCCAVNSLQESSKKAEAVAAPGSMLLVLVLSHCLKAWKDCFCRARLAYALICDMAPTSFAISDTFPSISEQAWERGATAHPRLNAWWWTQPVNGMSGEGGLPGPAQALR